MPTPGETSVEICLANLSPIFPEPSTFRPPTAPPVAMCSLDDATYLFPFANSFISLSHSHINSTRGIVCKT